jgi:hypothetical protein
MARLPDERLQQRREQLQRLAWLLDSSIAIPGTRFTFGVEALLGLVPFVGDAAGVLLSSYILLEAARMGAPKALVFRMAVNVAIEGIVGAVPLLGDIFDAAWKANQRNVRLLEAHFGEPKRATVDNRRWAVVVIAGLVVLFIFVGALSFLALRTLWNMVAA